MRTHLEVSVICNKQWPKLKYLSLGMIYVSEVETSPAVEVLNFWLKEIFPPSKNSG